MIQLIAFIGIILLLSLTALLAAVLIIILVDFMKDEGWKVPEFLERFRSEKK